MNTNATATQGATTIMNDVITVPAPPTEVGQRVRIISYGGRIPLWACGRNAVVVRFTRAGSPVLRVPTGGNRVEAFAEFTDARLCGRLIDDAGFLVRVPADSVCLDGRNEELGR